MGTYLLSAFIWARMNVSEAGKQGLFKNQYFMHAPPTWRPATGFQTETVGLTPS